MVSDLKQYDQMLEALDILRCKEDLSFCRDSRSILLNLIFVKRSNINYLQNFCSLMQCLRIAAIVAQFL